jgi:excinuclease ABC subunit A
VSDTPLALPVDENTLSGEPADVMLAYYACHGVMTDPRSQAHLLEGLPTAISALCQVVQGVLIHPLETDLYAVELTSIQKKEVKLRTVAEMLERISEMDGWPLTVPRQPKERLVGDCRDHATLFCAVLRQQGVPARVRVGFATYLNPEMNADHWVTEYWQPGSRGGGRWVMVDPQIDAAQRQAHAITFNTLDLAPRHFYTAGRAWSLCRAGRAKSGSFGHNRKQRGWNYLIGSLLRELAALNKVELLPWDIWWDLGRKGDEALLPEERALLDRLAELTSSDGRFAELRAAFEETPSLYQPVTSRLKLLGLLDNSKPRGQAVAGLTLRPADSMRLPVDRPLPSEAPLLAPTKPQTSLNPLTIPVDPNTIVVRGAAQHNLKHIDVSIPRYKLVVLTGVSGSGKSSLAFDTLYAEGQRRYVESLSSYVRRYMEQMDKPKVDFIGGLSPAIAIEQKSVSRNPRSTVGTVTEVMDYLRVLFSRAGVQHCPGCGRAIEPLSALQIADRLAAMPPGFRFSLLAPLLRNRKGNPQELLEGARQAGFPRARVDGQVIDLAEKLPRILKGEKHTIELVVDRLVVPPAPVGQQPSPAAEQDWHEFRLRLIDSVETSLRAGKGLLCVLLQAPVPVAGAGGNGSAAVLAADETAYYFSELNYCPHCDLTLPKLSASLFSFNAPSGMCPECNGLGNRLEVDPNLIIVNPELSLLDGASRWHGNIRKKSSWHMNHVKALADHYQVDVSLPWKDLPQKFRDVVLYGSGNEQITFRWQNEKGNSSWQGESRQAEKGVIHHINRLFRQTQSEYTKRWYVSFMSQQPCTACGGSRLCAEARYVTVAGKTFPEVLAMTIEQAHAWVSSLLDGSSVQTMGNGHLSAEQLEVVGEVLKEVQSRLRFMLNVGLHYLTLDRPAPTLSGGEGQRIRLASQLGCGLVGVLYILDEPSIGLHARDQRNLLNTLVALRDLGNTVLVVEHDAETMRTADWLIDLGPGAGILGGEIVSAGTPQQVAADPYSLTGRYLSGAKQVVGPNTGRRRAPKDWLAIYGARLFNLKSVDARFPLGVLTVVTGVSGSGKSSLVSETLEPALERALNGAQTTTPGPHDRIEGLELLDKAINIDQSPIGRTPRSNPATYVGVFDDIRKVFASTPEAKARGYKPDRFSFNVKGGRCEACGGHGWKRIEMHFLPDVWVVCQECKGARYNRHTLEITYKGRTIADVLDMDVQEALDFFSNHPAIRAILQTLHDVGLDYVKLGQSATTLSGGEAQRVKLAKELSRLATRQTIYILDEPTTGLHFADIQRLLDVLHRLVDAGNTVIVIEHNLDVIKTADWIIDLGPEGGAGGGYVIAEGTPEDVAQVEHSYTGSFLKEVLG